MYRRPRRFSGRPRGRGSRAGNRSGAPAWRRSMATCDGVAADGTCRTASGRVDRGNRRVAVTAQTGQNDGAITPDRQLRCRHRVLPAGHPAGRHGGDPLARRRRCRRANPEPHRPGGSANAPSIGDRGLNGPTGRLWVRVRVLRSAAYAIGGTTWRAATPPSRARTARSGAWQELAVTRVARVGVTGYTPCCRRKCAASWTRAWRRADTWRSARRRHTARGPRWRFPSRRVQPGPASSRRHDRR